MLMASVDIAFPQPERAALKLGQCAAMSPVHEKPINAHSGVSHQHNESSDRSQHHKIFKIYRVHTGGF